MASGASTGVDDVMLRRFSLAALALVLLVSGCGSGASVLRSSRVIRASAAHVAASEKSAAVAYFDPSGRAWAVGAGGALFVSTQDGGFRRIGVVPSRNPRTGVGYFPAESLAVESAHSSTIYVNADALYVSHDGGRVWRGTGHNAGGFWDAPVTISGPVVYALRAPDDHPCGPCDHLPGPWGLFATKDRGLTWHKVATHYANEIWGLTPALGQPSGSVFIETSSGLFLHVPSRMDVERDRGVPRSIGTPRQPPSTVLLAQSGRGHTLYMATSTGDNALATRLYVSDDHGKHWHLRRSPFQWEQGVLLGDPRHSKIAYAIVNSSLIRGTVQSLIGGYASEIFSTHDSANSWRPIWHGCLRVSFSPTPAVLTSNNEIVVQTCDGHIADIHT